MSQSQLTVRPYIFLYGRAEEALTFYQQIFGGTAEIRKNSSSPEWAECGLPAEWAEKVMHATFEAPGVCFDISDGRNPRPEPVDPEAGNISLRINLTDQPAAARIHAALADGGTIMMPLEPAFWGEYFGVVHDRFGTEWFITCPL